MIRGMGMPGALGLAALAAFAAGCGADIGSGGIESRPPDAAPRSDSTPAIDAASPPVDARPPCEGGDATAEGADGTCILYVATSATWEAARAGCVALGATLAIIDDREQNLLVSTIPPDPAGLPDIWTAGTDAGTEGEWHWLAGGPVFYSGGAVVTYAHWRTGEPNNAGGNENCMVAEGDSAIAGEGYTWDDRPCDLTYSYFCERP